ncbi:MAG: cob(I)yrinic acid a,c-diamide adenosyltransferase [Gammaproteobacteria bacterium]|nr:cob(I)yrinic acid a,c-diamide adenosyltransferase [Gammaproteobacteria bacterium]
MGNRLSKIYTRTGDDGTTGLGDGVRVDKDDPRIEAFGTVDELNSLIGVILAHNLPAAIARCLQDVQHDLFDLGGELSLPDYVSVSEHYVQRLEQQLDHFNATLPPLKEFILPAGGLATSHTHVARTVCRRAERRVFSLHKQTPVNIHILHYLNRLSDLLFVIARVCARHENGQEVYWQPRKNK